MRRVRSWLLKLLRALACGAALLAILWYLIPACSLYREDISWSPVLRDRHGEIMHVSLAKDDRYRIKVPLGQIDPRMIEATLLYEDEHFFSHPGVNPFAILRAILGQVQGVSRGGASTLSMQYARLRFDLKTNHLSGKCAQILRALQLERHHSKQEILEAYLNCAPYGGNIEGVAAASYRWCGTECRQLSTAECVALVMLPQRPAARMPRSGREELPDTMAARRRLLAKWQGTSDPMLAEYVWQPQAFPREVPHLARRFKTQGNIDLTIDSLTQQRVEQTLREYLIRQSEFGVKNAAVMVVDAPSREVLAYLGSADFFNDEIEGQNDGITARRSPGSLYKPFLYGLALDQGLLHSNTLLADAPMHLHDYNPENNERDFLGPVKAADALKRSRNLPALRLMNQVLGRGLFGYLEHAGLRLDHGASHYGLSLALGSAPASVEEIAQLYASLAADGQPRALCYEKGKTITTSSPPQLSDAARWLVGEMLIDNERDSLLRSERDSGDLSIKTGTSQGYHDAWAVGMSGRYVVVVWLGNFDHRSNAALKGRSMASPLVRQIFSHCLKREPYPQAPKGVSRAALCAVSGMMPCAHCQHIRQGWFIEGVSPIMPCDLHRQIWVNERTGKRVAGPSSDPDVKPQVHEFWSHEFRELFRQAGLPRTAIPVSDEVMVTQSSAPRITSPLAGHIYEISTSHAASATETGLICRADVAPAVSRLFWFANGKFLASTAPEEPYIWPEAEGICTIHVMDDLGGSASIRVEVERR